jgi:hypothetical protein
MCCKQASPVNLARPKHIFGLRQCRTKTTPEGCPSTTNDQMHKYISKPLVAKVAGKR